MPSSPSYRNTVTALALGQILSWAALYYTFTSFVLPMERTLGWGKPAMMGAFTLALVVWGLASYAVGVAIDRGRGRAVMAWGSALAAFGFALWSRVDSLPMLYATWAVLGAAMAMTLYETAFAILTRRYPGRYMRGITTLTLVGGFASTLAFPATAWLIDWLDWRGALLFIAGLMLFVVTPLHAWALRGHPAPPAAPITPDAPVTHTTLDAALRGPSFWLLTAAFTCYYFTAAALWVHAAKGLTDAQALSVVVWFGPAQVFGRMLHARFGRSLSPRALGLAMMALLPVSLALFALVDHLTGLLLFALLFGFVNGLITIVRGGVVPEYFGREHVGRISGAMSSITLLVRSMAPLATAWLLLLLPGYRELILALAAVGVASFACLALAGRPRAVSAGAPTSPDRSRASSA